MPDLNSVNGRRDFIFKSAVFFTGTLLGLKCHSKAFASPCSVKNPQLAIIIDDIGFSRSRLNNFLKTRAPLTFSILPRLAHSRSFARTVHDLGYEVMLHQPMEPINPKLDPGPGAIYVKDSPGKIINVIKQNISEIPFVTGINNHMGSRFTASRKEMEEALSAIKDNGLFFVDSLTTSMSEAYGTAKRMNISTIRRNIFLDNIQSVSLILAQLDRLKRVAMNCGQAIGIGHPFPETAAAINLFYKQIKKTNMSMVPISQLLS
ncbi:divergent polysaccharide deacetylase family protein [Thermodesulfobacteriota bacterium]